MGTLVVQAGSHKPAADATSCQQQVLLKATTHIIVDSLQDIMCTAPEDVHL
jgi:hypothetical protein